MPPMTRHACMAVNRRRSRLSATARTFDESQYAARNKIGGTRTAISKGRGGFSGSTANTPKALRTSTSAAHAMTTSQTGKVFDSVRVI